MPSIHPRRKYANPPIEEAVCELTFDGGFGPVELDNAFSLRKAFMEEYPAPPRRLATVQASLTAAGSDSQNLAMTQQGKLQFPASDGRSFVSVGNNVLSVHILRPYDCWERFRERILTAVDTYTATVGHYPVVRAGIRYVNRIALNSPAITLDDYFRIAPAGFGELPVSTSGFIQRTESVFNDDPTIKLVCTFASMNSSRPGTAQFLLDVDAVRQGVLPSDLATVIDDLRERERDAFESSITEKLREVFDAS